jgi:hypothetical protein
VILSTLDIKVKASKKHFRKTILTYLIVSILAIVVNRVYATFGHGVASSSMTWMFLYPLIGGGLLYFLISVFAKHITNFAGYRLGFNIYNSGIATLTFGSFLKGVMEIAGADSMYLIFYYVVGGLFIALGLISMLLGIAKQKGIR